MSGLYVEVCWRVRQQSWLGSGPEEAPIPGSAGGMFTAGCGTTCAVDKRWGMGGQFVVPK